MRDSNLLGIASPLSEVILRSRDATCARYLKHASRTRNAERFSRMTRKCNTEICGDRSWSGGGEETMTRDEFSEAIVLDALRRFILNSDLSDQRISRLMGVEIETLRTWVDRNGKSTKR